MSTRRSGLEKTTDPDASHELNIPQRRLLLWMLVAAVETFHWLAM
jgi:hypothetical protein